MKTGGAWLLMLALACAGCFYPPSQPPPRTRRDRLELALPYDLAWQDVHDVITRNHYRVIVEDPNHGIIETQAPGPFTLKDADCGKIRGMAGKFSSKPDIDASAVYNFLVLPDGGENSVVSVQAAFTAPLLVPFHPPSSVRCVSRGVQEERLLTEIARHARHVHRPVFKPAT
ncbi:MAG: hypothetical protein ACREQ4_03160 [Candidatus Binataceae bacterium]